MPQSGPYAVQAHAALEALLAACRSAGLTTDAPRSIDYGEQAVISSGADRVAVNVYGGKGGVRVVLGGKKDTPLYERAAQLIAQQQAGPSVVAPRRPETQAFPPAPWIGSDESGKGDYFGPLVAAAVYVAAGDEPVLRRAGVRDSKLLDDAAARRTAAEVRRLCAGRFAELVVAPADYNRRYAELRATRENLNHLLAACHAQVLAQLIGDPRLPAEPAPTVIADQFADERHVRERLQAALAQRGRALPALIQTPRAEANVAVAAASILARDRFLAWLAEASHRLGVELPKGGSKPSIIAAAREILARGGEPALAEIAKLHFATTKQVYAAAGRPGRR